MTRRSSVRIRPPLFDPSRRYAPVGRMAGIGRRGDQAGEPSRGRILGEAERAASTPLFSPDHRRAAGRTSLLEAWALRLVRRGDRHPRPEALLSPATADPPLRRRARGRRPELQAGVRPLDDLEAEDRRPPARLRREGSRRLRGLRNPPRTPAPALGRRRRRSRSAGPLGRRPRSPARGRRRARSDEPPRPLRRPLPPREDGARGPGESGAPTPKVVTRLPLFGISAILMKSP
jgi:hypothetical protein